VPQRIASRMGQLPIQLVQPVQPLQ
jgi:hypothetical protein